jgi:hypothetical protein
MATARCLVALGAAVAIAFGGAPLAVAQGGSDANAPHKTTRPRIARVPPALQFKCYFVAFDPGTAKNLTAATAHTFNSPRYRACIEENLKRLGLIGR